VIVDCGIRREYSDVLFPETLTKELLQSFGEILGSD